MEVFLSTTEGRTGWVEVTARVQDTGIGIPNSKLEYVFDKFAQADTSTTRKFGGTGLGLAIVKHVAVSHEAKLFVDSEVGKGSCFRLVFPNDRVSMPSDGGHAPSITT